MNEIIELLHAGFTHSEIMALVNQPGTAPAVAPAVAPAEAPAEAPEVTPAAAPAAAPAADQAVAPAAAPAVAPATAPNDLSVAAKLSELMNTIIGLKESIQLGNVLNSSQNEQIKKPETAVDAIAQIIRPTYKKKEDF